MLHREKEIERIAFNLVEALNGQIPSNMICTVLLVQEKLL